MNEDIFLAVVAIAESLIFGYYTGVTGDTTLIAFAAIITAACVVLIKFFDRKEGN